MKDLAESSSVQLSYLRASGFAPAEVIWSWEKFAFFYAAKPMVAVRAGVSAGRRIEQ
jgi:hypothetical protein